MQSFKKGKPFIFSVGLLLFSVLFCFLIGEIYLTIKENKEHARLMAKYKTRDLCVAYSKFPELIYTFIPNKCGHNSHGYRDHDYSYAKDERVFRIVIIGDSVAQGQGLKLEESFGKVLEIKLNNLSKSEKYKIEVIVLARSGYSTSQELFLLENEAFDYSPNLVIWSYVLNDPAHPIYHNANGELGEYFFKPKLHTVNFLSKRLFQLNEQIKKKNCEKEFHALLHCVYREQVESNIIKISQISEKYITPVIFLIHPIFEKNKDFDTYSLTPLHMRLNDFASKAGLIVLDLLNAYKFYNPNEIKQQGSETWFDPWHPNEKGNMIIAERIYTFMSERKYIKEWLIEIGLD
jgi:lysophospholipase L1-like esterase